LPTIHGIKSRAITSLLFIASYMSHHRIPVTALCDVMCAYSLNPLVASSCATLPAIESWDVWYYIGIQMGKFHCSSYHNLALDKYSSGGRTCIYMSQPMRCHGIGPNMAIFLRILWSQM